ncbi:MULTISPECIES: Rpn family recombination-promoting nuclease/putative transposase [Nitrincola]|nr:MULTISPECIES: Rpn family recombination-promoting nuclease/putative transposase [Nitrincola]
MQNFDLLDPRNDYVFKRIFAEAPDLLVHLINDVRPDLPSITSVEVLNPSINPAELTGKYIILDVLAQDAENNRYNIEMQVRRYNAWGKRSAYYLARMLSEQLDAGMDYAKLQAAVGIHLLDFDLFMDNEAQQQQAVWRFEMRDEKQPDVRLGNELQVNLIELKKADRLELSSGSLRFWIEFLEHWQSLVQMVDIPYEPVKKAMERLKMISADDEERRLAFVRQRAMHDEATLLKEAREGGFEQGIEKGIEQGIEKGRQALMRETALKLIAQTEMDDVMIAELSGLSVDQVEQLRLKANH